MTEAQLKRKKFRPKEYLKEHDIYKCEKCCRTKKLEVHHIIPLVDGGTNDHSNLICLCGACHSEWHRREDFYKDFKDFMKAPPEFLTSIIIPKYLRENYEDLRLTPKELEYMSIALFDAYKLINTFYEYDDIETYDQAKAFLTRIINNKKDVI